MEPSMAARDRLEQGKVSSLGGRGLAFDRQPSAFASVSDQFAETFHFRFATWVLHGQVQEVLAVVFKSWGCRCLHRTIRARADEMRRSRSSK